MTKAVMTAKEAVEVMRAAGFSTSEQTVKLGIKQGQFPFGAYISADGVLIQHDVCYVYSFSLYKWLEQIIAGYTAPAGSV